MEKINNTYQLSYSSQVLTNEKRLCKVGFNFNRKCNRMSENALASSLVKCWNVVEIVMWWHILTDIMSIFFFCLFCLKKNPNACALAVHIGAKVVLKLSLNFYHPKTVKVKVIIQILWNTPYTIVSTHCNCPATVHLCYTMKK